MRDWTAIVSARLAALGLDGDRENEIRAELAGHLEDLYTEARRCGSSEDEALTCALERVPDWTHLARAIRRADRKGEAMTHDTRTIVLPGMAALCCAAAVILSVAWLPPALWVDPRARAPMTAVWLTSYLAFGAIGANWSRRAGGTVAARYLAAIFPLALHLAIVVPALVVSNLTEGGLHPERLRLNLQFGVVVFFVVIPGVALTIGALPFLRDRATASHAS